MIGVTQSQIADNLGVSRQAVAFALSERTDYHKKLRPETRRRILAEAVRMDYSPNRAARSLRLGKTETITLATHSSLRYFYTSDLIEELEVALSRHDYHLNLELLHYMKDAGSAYRAFGAGNCDGLIHYDPIWSEEEHTRLLALRRRGLPVVVVSSVASATDLDVVSVDIAEAARLGAAHLLEQGHRRIAHVVDAVDGVVRQTRLKGIRRALAAVNVAYDETLVLPWSVAENPSGLWAQISRLSPRPTALTCNNGELTIALFLEIRKHGGRVPQDIAIVSEDDPPLDALLDVPITGVDRKNRHVAEVVVERLLGQMRDPHTSPQQILVKPVLRERQSSQGRIA